MMMFYAVFLQFVGFVQAVVNEWGLIHFRRNEQTLTSVFSHLHSTPTCTTQTTTS